MNSAKKILVTTAIVVASSRAYGQSKELKLDDLKMPNSPAFILLDVAPTSIDRPTSTKAFATSVLNNVNQNNGIPQNYAVEFTPYWFVKHPKLTAFKYWGYNKEEDKQLVGSQAKYLSVSFATVNSSVNAVTGKNYNNMSLGVRSTLLNVRKNKKGASDIDDLKAKNLKFIQRVSQINDENIRKSPAEVAELVDNDATLRRLGDDINEILNRKPIVALDFAAASSWAFDDTNYSSGRFNRAGAWLTGSISTSNEKVVGGSASKKNYLNIYFTARYLHDRNTPNGDGTFAASDLGDGGGKIEFELERFSLSYEFLYRLNLNDNSLNTYRSSGLLKYIASERVNITAAFGRNFGQSNNLITQISINFGLNGSNSAVLPQ
jgi:hypothetical protein